MNLRDKGAIQKARAVATEIMNKKTSETKILFGGISAKVLFEKNNLDSNEWSVIHKEYID